MRRAILRGIAVIPLNAYHNDRPIYTSKAHEMRVRVAALAVLPTWLNGQVTSAGDDAPIRKRATPRSQVSKDAFLPGGFAENISTSCSTRFSTS